MKEDRKMTSSTVSGSLSFVDREEEMKRIKNSLKRASTGEGELLIIRGEAGSGKTRLLQEAAAEAEKQGFSVGFGTALAESVVPYHPWKEVLEGLGLDVILKELPPPKLLGLYLITADGDVKVKVEREGAKSKLLSDLISSLEESVTDSKAQKRLLDGDFILVGRDGHKSILWQGSDVHLGAIVEGDEDEAFLADLLALGDKAESILSGEASVEGDPCRIAETHLRQLLDSEIYEGIDYAKEDPELRQNKLFEHITLGLSRKARSCPLCVVVDDLQWADPSSLALLQYAARNTRKAGVSILGTYRAEEAESRPHLKESLKGLEQEGTLDEMDLNGLTREDLADLVGSFIGSHSLSEGFLDDLWWETRGFPLFVREVMLGLEEDGEIVTRGAVKCVVRPLEKVALPKRVKDVIRARLDRLPNEDRRLLDVAATCGSRFTASIVSKVASEEETKVLNGLGAIAKIHGLLHPTDSGFAFNHPAVQEVLYDGVPVEIRQNYHREVAEWLEVAGGPIEDVAEHYYKSGDSRAVAKLRMAAEVSFDKHANDEAVGLLGEAIQLATPEERGDLMEQQADALEAAARYDEALMSSSEAIKNGAPIARCKRRIASVLLHQGLFDDALAASEEGLDESDEDERGRLLTVQAEALVNGGKYSEATERAELALDAFASNEDPTYQAKALHTIGMVHYYEGRCDETERVLLEVLAMHESKGDRRAIGASLNTLGNILTRHGDLERALDYLRKALKMRESISDLNGVSGSLNNIGNVYGLRGDFSRALEYYRRALKISEAIGNRMWIMNQAENIGSIYYHLGDLDQAIRSYKKCLAMREASGGPEGLILTLYNLGNAYQIQGDMDSALKYYQRSLSIAEDMGHKVGVASALAQVSSVYTELGDHVSALEV
ncbi:MAG: BREX system ATP-binding domain-containing protein, partial [Thermoplasmata archaeon]